MENFNYKKKKYYYELRNYIIFIVSISYIHKACKKRHYCLKNCI